MSLSAVSMGFGISFYITTLMGISINPPSSAIEYVSLFLPPLITFLLTLPTGHFGDLVRALSLAILFSLKRFPRIRVRYATWPHIRSSLFLGKRVPFPPGVDNPFQYVRKPGPINRSNPRFR